MVSVTFDGSKVSRFLGHVTGGFKLVDQCCINPKSGELLFGKGNVEKVQLHVHCFPIKVAFAKDTKDLYCIEFADFFCLFKRIYSSRHILKLEDNRQRWHGQH